MDNPQQNSSKIEVRKTISINKMIVKRGIIYKLTSPSNKSYVGLTTKTLQKRIKQHWRSGTNDDEVKWDCRLLHAAIYLHQDINLWRIEILMECDNSELDEAEVNMIKLHNTFMPNGYNMTKGGRGIYGIDPDPHRQSENQCKYKDKYQHVFGIRTTCASDPKRGFRVFTSDDKYRSFTFTSWRDEDHYLLQMNRMYERAVKYKEEVKETDLYKPPLSHYIDDLEVPLGIDKAGGTGFAFKLGKFKAFTSKKNSRIFNLILTINHYLNIINYDSLDIHSLEANKYEYALQLYEMYEQQYEEQSSSTKRELVEVNDTSA